MSRTGTQLNYKLTTYLFQFAHPCEEYIPSLFRFVTKHFVFPVQGYFQSLFSCMENLLQSLNVEKLVLPSAEEAKSIWTNRFNFTKITEEQVP